MALAEMKTKLILLLWLACQCTRPTTSVQSCALADCTPIMNGRMCASDTLTSCCPASCTFKQIGTERAEYNIYEITMINSISQASTCSTLFGATISLPQDRFSVKAKPVGNTCPLYGTCQMHYSEKCYDIVHQKGIFINDDYVKQVQTMTNSQSLSTSFSNYPSSTQLTNTDLPVHGYPRTEPTSSHLPMLVSLTKSRLDGQSMLKATPLPATISSSAISTISSSQMPSSLLSSSGSNQQMYAIVAGVLAAGLFSAIFIIATVTCLILLFVRGRRMPDKSRVAESCNNLHVYAEVSQRTHCTPVDSQYSEILAVTNNVHTYNVLEDPSARYLHNPPATYETISPTHARFNNGHVHKAEPIYSNPQGKEPVYSNPQVKEPVYSTPQVKKPTYSSLQANEPTCSNPQVKEPTYSNSQMNEPTYSNPEMNEPTCSNSQMNKPTCSNPKVNEPTCSNPQKSEPTRSNPIVKEPTHSNPQVNGPVYSDPQVEEPTKNNLSEGSTNSEQAQVAVYRTVVRQGGKKVTTTILPAPPQNSDQPPCDSPTNDNNPIVSKPEYRDVSKQDGKDITSSTVSTDQSKHTTANLSVKSISRHREYSTVIRQEGKKVTATLIPQQLDSDPPFLEETESVTTLPIMNILKDPTDQAHHRMYTMVVRQNGEKVSVRVRAQSNAD